MAEAMKDAQASTNESRAQASASSAVTQREPGASLDNDSRSQTRKTFIVLLLAASVVCAIPRQWVSALILLVLALVLSGIHRAAGRSAA